MSDLSIRLIGVVSLALSVALQLTRFAAEHQSWDIYPSFSLSYSVHPYFLYAALVIQTILQVYWLLKPRSRIQLTDMPGMSDIEKAKEKESTNDTKDCMLQAAGPLTFFDRFSYMPVYLFSNAFLIMWIIAISYDLFAPALAILLCSACIQLYGLFVDPSKNICKDELTMVVAKFNSAYTIMVISQMCAILEATPSPPIVQLVNHGLIFVLLTIGSGLDPTFGLALVYILASLYHGSYFNALWRDTFYWTAAIITAITTLDYALRNFQDIDDSDQKNYEEPESEKNTSLSGGESRKQTPMPLRIPDYFAGAVELPLPLSTADQEEHSVGLFAGGVDSYQLPSFMRCSEKHGREQFVSPDYFSYAFHV